MNELLQALLNLNKKQINWNWQHWT